MNILQWSIDVNVDMYHVNNSLIILPIIII